MPGNLSCFLTQSSKQPLVSAVSSSVHCADEEVLTGWVISESSLANKSSGEE